MPNLLGVLVNCIIPNLIQVFQAFLAPVIAVVVAMIAFLQWRTAHHRVVIDLFDRRMKIYAGCRDTLHKVISNPRAATTANALEFVKISADAEFLFGSEVLAHLKMVEKTIFDLATFEAELKGTISAEERKDLLERSRRATDTISSFYHQEFRSMLMPYLGLKQRL